MQLSARCRGFALIEALLALLILAFGMLSLLWTHQQALVSQRQQLMLSVAMGMADDFAERMRLNATHRSAYAKSWGSSSPSMLTNCVATPCSRSELASWDFAQLQQSLQTLLPEGDAAVFQLTTPHWWGIVIAWRDASESYRTDSAAGSPACPAQMSCWRLLFRPDR